jgi:adenylate cyclase
VERRLAAILVADVVGYSRLMGEDEAATLSRLKAAREEVLQPLIAEHRGRVVKLMGDGLLVEFASVVDAVECAHAWQERICRRESDRDENARLLFRIGINLGDVITEGEDIYGDGVNIAARLEALAEPGGICISGGVHEQVRGKISYAFQGIGPQSVKNIARPVDAYTLRPDDLVTVGPATSGGHDSVTGAKGERPAIAVLAFKNLSGDADQEYFADGVAEDIITALSRHRWLTVIARNSSFTYKGQGIDLKRVSRQLGVRYVLDGSVRKAGNRVRVGAQLIDAGSGNQIWAGRYDRVLEDIFAVQDEITGAIVAAIAPELGKAEQQHATSKKSENLNAWEAYQRGMWHLYQRTRDDLAEARRLFATALSLDPGLSAACCAGLVDAYYYEVVLGLAASATENRSKALEAARRAVELDPEDAAAHCAMGKARIVRREHVLAVPDLQLAIELNPSLAWAHYGLGAAAEFRGQPEQAIEHLERAIRLSRAISTWGPSWSAWPRPIW